MQTGAIAISKCESDGLDEIRQVGGMYDLSSEARVVDWQSEFDELRSVDVLFYTKLYNLF